MGPRGRPACDPDDDLDEPDRLPGRPRFGERKDARYGERVCGMRSLATSYTMSGCCWSRERLRRLLEGRAGWKPGIQAVLRRTELVQWAS